MRFSAGAFVVAVASLAAPLAAQSPVQLALFTPIQIVPEKSSVGVVRLNFIYSVNQSVKYVDLGFVNVTKGAGSEGIQWAFVAINEGSFTGWQSAFVSVSKQGKGLQWSGLNMSDNWHGLQLGLVNYALQINGVQIGLINIIKKGGMFPVFPIVNWSK